MGTALLSFQNKPLTLDLSRSIRYRGGLFTYHLDSSESNGKLALLEFEGTPGSEPPLHVHRNEDELFYVLEGKLRVCVGGQELTLSAGQSSFLPRGVPHAFKILSPRARFLVYITPGGFEEFFRETGEPLATEGNEETGSKLDVSDIIRVAGRYSVTFMP